MFVRTLVLVAALGATLATSCQQVPPAPDWLAVETAEDSVDVLDAREVDGGTADSLTDLAPDKLTPEVDAVDVADALEPAETDAAEPLPEPAETDALDLPEPLETFDEGPCLPQTCVPAEHPDVILGPCERLDWNADACRCEAFPKGYKESCDDGDVCTLEDFCDEDGDCSGRVKDCDDGNECTDEQCQSGQGCVSTDNKGSCDDGNPCTTPDKCKDGACVGQPSPICAACDEADDHCEAQYGDAALGAELQNLCNGVLRCVGGKCVVDAETVVACPADEDTACLRNTCAPATGLCAPAPAEEGTQCTDGNPCTTDDACAAGACVGEFDTAVAGCACEADADCGPFENGDLCDGVLSCQGQQCLRDAGSVPGPCSKEGDTACRRNRCQPLSGLCQMAAVPNGQPCYDGNPCTLDDACQGGACVSGQLNECAHLGDDCKVGQCLNTDGACTALPYNEGGACVNADKCAASARCSTGTCLTLTEISCDDGDACTADDCDPATGGCLHELVANETAELCNAADDDCDGSTDEGLVYVNPGDGQALGLGLDCDGVGECGEGVVECGEGGVTTCSSNPDGSGYGGRDEVCNGRDDDCDGAIDNGLSWRGVGIGEACDGEGECGAGVVECALAAEETTCSTNPQGSAPEALVEACNGLDDDCDGATDEELEPQPTTCLQAGVCGTAAVVVTCGGEAGWACDYSSVPNYQAGDEALRCDGRDNDCDGQTDEDFALGEACDSDDTDACANGRLACAGDGAGTTCLDDVPRAEECGGGDEDCDGTIDEADAVGCEPYLRDADGDGHGANDDARCLCAPDPAGGYTATLGGDCDDDAVTGPAVNPGGLEVCNGHDDDCDGATDGADGVDLVLNDQRPCELQAGECTGSVKPTSRCAEGGWQACQIADYVSQASAYEAGAETACDGRDNDCDGATDEDFTYLRVDGTVALGVGLTCGRGACEGGLTECKADRTGLKCSTAGNAAPEVCDGQDNDCDGLVDAADADLASNDTRFCEAQAGVCEGTRKPIGLCEDGNWRLCDVVDYLAQAAEYEGELETSCDGQDNDCDGSADEDFELTQPDGTVVEGVGQVCGLGSCAGGVTTCDAAGAGLTCDATAGMASEVCDDLDNDCDGLVDVADPDLVLTPCIRQQGVCAGATRTADLCRFGSWIPCPDVLLAAHSLAFEPGAEVSCDGLDNDCDGQKDEDFTLSLPGRPELRGVDVPCGLGACEGGLTACNDDGDGLVCPSADDGAPELCNGQDDDCDGETDEGLDATAADSPCAVVGLCSPTNVVAACDGGAWTCDTSGVAGYEAGVEATCDGQDNDCDGATDEDLVDGEGKHKGDACTRAGCTSGVVVCDPVGGALACSLDLAGQVEICDGKDNDCDGFTDEGLQYADPVTGLTPGLGQPCQGRGECGEGVVECAADGAVTCSSNADGSASAAAPEACNGLDDDCDGLADDGLAWSGLALGAACDGVGACGIGVVECGAGGVATCSTNPNGTASGVGPETCNGADDDCDGTTDGADPDLVRVACEVSAGVCLGARKPASACVAGVWLACASADYRSHSIAYEEGVEATCDGKDNDCNGATDEDFSLTGPSGAVYNGVGQVCGVGACAGGTTVCRSDQAGLRCTTHANVTTELCNGQDDDCDGKTDGADGVDLAQFDRRPCEKSAGACAGAIKPIDLCLGGAWQACGSAVYQANNALFEEGAETRCDGLDNDCDGTRDEDFSLKLRDGSTVTGINRACGAGACSGGVTACDALGAGLVCPSEANVGLEVCNGLDDDCDGLLDAADAQDLGVNDPQPCQKQVGVCLGATKPASLCEGGAWGGCTATVYASHAAAYQAGAETTCDGQDNDCDGTADEDFTLTGPSGVQYSGVGLPCGVGACAGGTTACLASQQGLTCSTYPKIGAETCNGKDDDCDGKTDAADATDLLAADPRACEKQQGVCNGASKPARLCQGGAWAGCDAAAYLGTDAAYEAGLEATCDNKDNDCDGTADEDFSLTQKNGAAVAGTNAACGVGECAGGYTACNAARNGLVCPTEVKASAELCNGKDDDCDGLQDATDADLAASDPKPCAKQSGVCAGALKPVSLCVNGTWGVCGDDVYETYNALYEPAAEVTCDAKDNDCDGSADEDFVVVGPSGTTYQGVGKPCGLGACAGGVTVCTPNRAGLTCTSYELISQEVCNGKDDDCDGLQDAADAVDLVANEPKSCEKQQGVCSGAKKPAGLCKQAAWTACVDATYAEFSALFDAGSETRCDGRDNDCDGVTDEEMPDPDGDGLSDCVDPDDDNDGILDDGDASGVVGDKPCRNAAVSCDDNCRVVANPPQADLDGDGLGDGCDDDLDGDGSANALDCAPTDPARHANALEVCNGVDDDCDGATDAADGADLASDDPRPCENQKGVCAGSAKPAGLCTAGTWQACAPATYTASSVLFDGAAEARCDGYDNDCDGATDEDFSYAPPGGGATKKKGDPCGTGACAGGTVVCNAAGAGLICSTDTGVGFEKCDGVDNDCDGQTDAQDADLLTSDRQLCTKQQGVCAGLAKPASLCVGGAWLDCTDPLYTAYSGYYQAGVEATCDGVDNDCDGAIDEDFQLTGPNGATYDGVGKDCGVGVCAGGKTQCRADKAGLTCSTFGNLADEICDGSDNDCDGQKDAQDVTDVVAGFLRYDQPPCANTSGVCAGTKKLARLCVNGGWAACGDAEYAEQRPDFQPGLEAACDTRDNDCNGATDEDFTATLLDGTLVVGAGKSCGAGACQGGVTECTPAGTGLACSTEALKGLEKCGNGDEDCDGKTDAADATDLLANDAKTCEKQSGVCAGAAKPAALCSSGAWQACTTAEYVARDSRYQAGAEVSCDGLNNDCDNGTDEDFLVTMPDGATLSGVGKTCGVGACSGGVTECKADKTGTRCTTAGNASSETCGAGDQDCDGKTDAADTNDLTAEGYFVNDKPPCEKTAGVCAGSKKKANLCTGGAWTECSNDVYLAHSAAYEAGAEKTCDGQDNDCNGSFDEDFSFSGPSGVVYNGVGGSCGVGECNGGTTVCTADKKGSTCSTFATKLTLEMCDNKDNDCDGKTDAADTGDVDAQGYFVNEKPACQNQTGACLGAKRPAALCVGGAWQNCTATQYGVNADYETAETRCDGKDNDCDGASDAVDLELQATLCEDQDGVCNGRRHDKVQCLASGWQACTGSQYGPEYQVAESRCDGRDNDCDTQTDADDAGLATTLCELQAGVCASKRHVRSQCTSNGWQACTAAEYGPDYVTTESRCDGRDNDCDGLTDAADTADLDANGFFSADRPACEKTIGACANSAKPARLCVAGAWVACDDEVYAANNAAYDHPTEVRCDAFDNDCDGVADESTVVCAANAFCLQACRECYDENTNPYDGCDNTNVWPDRSGADLAGNQQAIALASWSDGGFVIAWSDDAYDGSNAEVEGRRFTRDGVPLGAEARWNETLAGLQHFPAVATFSDGRHVAVWQDDSGRDGSGKGLLGRVFGRDGAPTTSEFVVNATTSGDQMVDGSRSTVAVLDDGTFVVVYTECGVGDGSDCAVVARRLRANGAPVGDEVRVNTTAANLQVAGEVAAQPGGYVAVWTSQGQDGSVGGVYLRRFANDGTPRSAEVQVNDVGYGDQGWPSVAAWADGSFVVTWDDNRDEAGYYDVRAFVFTAEATPIWTSSSRVMNLSTSGYQGHNDVAALEAVGTGGSSFVVAWESASADFSRFDVAWILVSKSGAARTEDALLMPPAANAPSRFPAVASRGAAGFVVAATATNAGLGWDLMFRLYDASGLARPTGDADGDHFTDVFDTDDDGDGTSDALDCGPQNAAVFPGATEVCNGLDDDCDGQVDEQPQPTMPPYADTDADGVKDCADWDDDGDGDGDLSDCADTDATRATTLTEECVDGVDNDCNGVADDGAWCPSGCGSMSQFEHGAPWPMQGVCPTHVGRSAHIGPSRPRILWTGYTYVNSLRRGPSVGADDSAYSGSASAWNVFRFGPDGALRWMRELGGWIDGVPALAANGKVYAVNAWWGVSALDATTGVVQWSAAMSDYNMSSPTIGPDGVIYAGDDYGKLWAANPDGSPKWSTQVATGQIRPSPALSASGKLYVASADFKLYEVDAATGGVGWSYATFHELMSPPVLGADGTIFQGSRDGWVYALRPNGTLKWATAVGGGVAAGLALGADGTVYAQTCIGNPGNGAIALHPDTGAILWTRELAMCGTTAPTVDRDGTIYVGSSDGKLSALSPIDGSVVWSIQLGGSPVGQAALASNGTLYVAASNETLYAIGEADADGDGVPVDDLDGQPDPCQAGVATGCDDNCPAAANATQADADGDGIGDACELTCGGTDCPALPGYGVACNASARCEYTNPDRAGWRVHDAWIFVPAGSLPMGTLVTDPDWMPGSMPQHTVTFSSGYFVQKHEVTTGAYASCQASAPGSCGAPSAADWTGLGWGVNSVAGGRSDHPQNGLTWDQASAACAWLGGRLPSEAEWEYAATGTVHRLYPWGATPEATCAGNLAVFDGDGDGTRPWGCQSCTTSACSGTQPVGSKPAGAAWSGALDMAGNTWEWCHDWYHDGYNGAPADGSAWTSPAETSRVLRGGCFNNGATYLRSAARGAGAPTSRDASRGARCVRELPGSDYDHVPADGDRDGTAGNHPCEGGATTWCDDNCPDMYNPTQADADGDGAGDACDCAPTNDALFPGALERCNGLDDDCDGLIDRGCLDVDDDNLPNGLDPDDDNDGVLDDGSASGVIGDATCIGGATTSCDDNCRFTTNASQADANGTGQGDACETCGVNQTLTVSNGYNLWINSNYKPAQVVTVGALGKVSSIALNVQLVGGAAGSVAVDLYGVTAVTASQVTLGSLLATSASVTASSLPGSFGWVTFVFTNGPLLTAGQKVAIRPRYVQTGSNYVDWKASNNLSAYAGGDAYDVSGYASNRDVLFELNTCAPTCPSRTTLDPVTGRCADCPAYCATCSSTGCTTCVSGASLVVGGDGNYRCEASCTEETCNGIDDNCDGVVDDTWYAKGVACDGGDADSCARGTYTCGTTALLFDGVDDHVALPANSFSTLTNATIEAWVRFDDFAQSNSAFFGLGAAGSSNEVRLGHFQATNNLVFYVVSNSTSRFIEATNALVLGKWHHVAATCGADGMKLFVDGVLVGSNAYTACLANVPDQSVGYLGRTVSAVYTPFKGALQGLRVSNVQRYTAVFTPPRRDGGGDMFVEADWALNEGSGTVAMDRSGNGRHGTLTSGPTWTSAGQDTIVCTNETASFVETCNGVDDDCDGSVDETGDALCNNHGACGGASGCVCQSGFTGAACDACDTGFLSYPACTARVIEVGTAGGGHTCAVLEGGAVWCWGANGSGQVGDGSKTNRSKPVKVALPAPAQTMGVLGQRDFSCALLTTGDVYCWGSNTQGQLGDGTLIDRSSPVKVQGLPSGVIDIQTGGEAACVRTSAGEVWCWGDNGAGQLGNGTTTDSLSPVRGVALYNIGPATKLRLGTGHACALVGTALYCWGSNFKGTLGNNSNVSSSLPVAVSGMESGFSGFRCGDEGSCAMMSDGTVKCWGSNFYGSVGDNSTTDRWVPTLVRNAAGTGNLAGVSAIGTGGLANCAIVSGAVYCWGKGDHGEMGNGTTTMSNKLPKAVSGVTTAAFVDAGSYSVCVLTTANSVKCWGYNAAGQLGDGTTTQRTTPVDVVWR